jgi:hypothetical protein
VAEKSPREIRFEQAMLAVRKNNKPAGDAAAASAYAEMVKAGEAMPLKRKYRTSTQGKFAGGERAAKPKKRHKVGRDIHAKTHVQRAVTLVVEGRTGKSVLVGV